MMEPIINLSLVTSFFAIWEDWGLRMSLMS